MKCWQILDLKIAVPDFLHEVIADIGGDLSELIPEYTLFIADKEPVALSFDLKYTFIWGEIFFCNIDNAIKRRIHIINRTNHHLPAVLSDLLVCMLKNITHNSFLFHSVTFASNGKGFLVPGKADRGKTTFAGHLPANMVLDDELSAIYEKDNTFYILALPVVPVLKRDNPYKWQGPYPLEKIIFLRRDLPSGIKDISRNKACSFLSEEGPFFYQKKQHKIFEVFCLKLLDKTPAKLLSYKKGDKLDPVLLCS